MIFFLAVLVSTCLVVIGFIHVYWIFGGKRGLAVVIPSKGDEPLFKPTTFGTAVVVIMLWVAAFLLLLQVNMGNVSIPGWIPRLFCWGMVAAFYLRVIGDFRWIGIFKQFKSSSFAIYDTRLYIPLCFFLGTLMMVIMLNT